MNELALFAGAGGGILGGRLLGWRTVCAVEFDAYAASVLVARQNDGCLAPFPVWDDVRTFDGRPWRDRVDVISGGFPCQDISAAGAGKGIEGARSGLWREMARIVGEVRPRFVLVENSPMLTSRGLGIVLGDLAALGFNAEWGVLGAADAGAPHIRDRIWILAYADGERVRQQSGRSKSRRTSAPVAVNDGTQELLADTKGLGLERSDISLCNEQGNRPWLLSELGRGGGGVGSDWWATEPDVGRVAHGVASRVDRIHAIGNGQVPAVAALAWRLLAERAGIQ